MDTNENVITTGRNPWKIIWSETNNDLDTYREVSAIETKDGVFLKTYFANIDDCGESVIKLDGVKIEDL